MQFTTTLMVVLSTLAAAAPTPSPEAPELTTLDLEARSSPGNVNLLLDATPIAVPIGIPLVVAQQPRQAIQFVSAPAGTKVACQVDLKGRPPVVVGNLGAKDMRVALGGEVTSLIRCSTVA